MSEQSLSEKLTEFRNSFLTNVPADIQAIMANATEEVTKSALVENAPKTGDKLKTFELSDQNGKVVTLQALLANGPLVITFYRGGWCPYCNLELKGYQEILPEIKAAGGSLVAITPELPDASLSTSEKNELAFTVLSDVNADYARELGLVFTLPEELKPIYQNFGIDLEQHNGCGQFDLPLAATFVIAQDGTVASSFVDADYTLRQEPKEVLEALRAL